MLAITNSIENNTIITIENQDQKMSKSQKVMMTIASYKNEKTMMMKITIRSSKLRG
jgi:hypothetical protein